MSVRDPNWRKRPRVWTQRRLLRLGELLDRGWSDAEIAAEMGTTPEAVNLARKKHGLLARTRRAYTARHVADLLGIGCSKTVVAWIHAGWLHAHRGPRIGLHRHYMVRHDDLVAFLANPAHWHRWEPERIDPDSDLGWWARQIRAGVRFLTVGEVAARCCVEVNTVSGWIRSGILPAVRNGNWLVRESDLAAFTPPGQRSRVGTRRRSWTPQEDQRLLAMRAAGIGWTAIARELGRPVSSVFGRHQRLTAREEVAA